MKAPEFSHQCAWWDKYRAFHMDADPGNGPYASYSSPHFVLFDTGELIVTKSFDGIPDARREYKKLNIAIIGTADEKCPSLYLDPRSEKPVTRSHLSDRGNQVLLIDYDAKMCVKLADSPYVGPNFIDTPEHAWRRNIPKRLRDQCTAYYAGTGSVPQGEHIMIRSKCKLTPQEKERIEGLHIACQMWERLNSRPRGEIINKFVHESNRLKHMDMSTLSIIEKYQLSAWGWQRSINEEFVPCLFIK